MEPLLTSDGFQPNGKSRGLNSGTKGSINIRRCCVEGCGVVGEHKQMTAAVPPSVWCASCGSDLAIRPSHVRMRPNPEEKERMQQKQSAQCGSLGAVLAAQREAGIAEMLEDNPRPSLAQQKRRYDQLVENCSRRPEPRGFFYNPLGRALRALICACNCAINLVAKMFPPVVFMLFLYLFGCTCAKKGDIVAIPKVYVVYAIAVYTLMHEQNVVNLWAFVNYRSMEQWLDHKNLPKYDRNGGTYDENYDREERSDSMRVSLVAAKNKDTLVPMSRYQKDDDFLGEITSETVGHSSIIVVEIACIVRGVETVVAVKCRRRQFVMRYLAFAFALGTFAWSAAHVLDFEALQEGVAAATIDNIIESNCKGQRGVSLVNKFVALYMPIFEMLKAFLIKAFGGRLPDEDELEVVLNRYRGKVRLCECQLQDSAVSGRAESRAADDLSGKVDALLEALQEDLSQSRVKEAFRANEPGRRGKAWSFAYGARDYAYAAVAAVRGVTRRRDDADDDDCGPSKRLRDGEGMPAGAADWDGSCKELEPQGSTDPRAGVRRHLLADISRHQARNAVHQLPIGQV